MVQDTGHLIKAGSALMDSHSLRECAFEIEKAGKSHDLSLARRLVNKLESEYEKFSLGSDF